ncbi:DUF58 domain-containing protein [Leifsonia sp. Leaf264]|uniref:DUF58 domain-containing protein n=1 Tax=Leifsonia sp. Leaf264 TaxID=1736314 RepID=UPI0006F416D1|nr:DUF58 domain-containing protein [Leifsonia sp. Leaf264]KQP01323.1 hypothetical protein ASF30_01475 [Leifsonia sp. Leaf264]
MADDVRSQKLWWPRPTLRGWAFLAAGIAMFLYGLFLERRDALFVACFLIAIPLVAMGYVLVRRMRVHVTRSFSPVIVPAGSEAVVSLIVQNLSMRPSYGARWRDQAEAGISVPESALMPSLGRHGRVDEGDTARLEYTLTPRRRGVFGIGPLILDRADPFGLASGEQSVGVPHDLVVTPRVSPLPGNALSLTNGDGSMHELLRHSNPNSDELIAREYRPGDPLRRMNWPATARHGELMVRQEEQRSNPEARLIIDTTHSVGMRGGSNITRPRLDGAFELSLEMAASIGIHLLDAGFRLDVIETGSSQLSPAADRIRGGLRGDTPTPYRLPAGDRDLLEGLANLQLPAAGSDRDTRADSPGSAIRNPGSRLPTFAVLIDVDVREAQELAALRPYCEPAVAFVIDTVAAVVVEQLEDAGWRCVPLRNTRGIAEAWEQTGRDRRAVGEPV